MDIKTKHVDVETLAVTIQALHVNGKQMTVAMFKQLYEPQATTDIEQFWGIVHYTLASQPYTSQWVVGSCKGQLYRLDIERVPDALLVSLPQLFIAI